MAQTTQGLYSILSSPRIYSFFESAIGAFSGRKRVIREVVRPQPGDRVLDIGCGPGDVFAFFPEGVHYVGFDENESYIESARKRFGDRATFHCHRVSERELGEQGDFDIVLAFGVLHHLDDAEAEHLFHLAARALKPGGRLVTFDGCYTPEQSRVARWFLNKDRGKSVRTRDVYVQLAQKAFQDINASVHHDLFRIPYTILVLECRR